MTWSVSRVGVPQVILNCVLKLYSAICESVAHLTALRYDSESCRCAPSNSQLCFKTIQRYL